VARQRGLDRRTVGKYARARTWQEVVRRPPRKPSTRDPYLDYLQQRWDKEQHSAKILHEELQTKGYLGHYERVKMAVAPLRRGLPPGRATRATALTTRSRPLDHHPPGSPQPTDQRPPAAAPAHRALS
jgi:transposase